MPQLYSTGNVAHLMESRVVVLSSSPIPLFSCFCNIVLSSLHIPAINISPPRPLKQPTCPGSWRLPLIHLFNQSCPMHTIFSLYPSHKSAIYQSSETFFFSHIIRSFFLNPHLSNSPIHQTPRKGLFSLLDLYT